MRQPGSPARAGEPLLVALAQWSLLMVGNNLSDLEEAGCDPCCGHREAETVQASRENYSGGQGIQAK